MLELRGEPLKVSTELSPRRKVALSNMFKAESFLKKGGVKAESYTLWPKSSKFSSKASNEDLGEPLSSPSSFLLSSSLLLQGFQHVGSAP